MQAADEELANHLSQLSSGGHSIPFASPGASATPTAHLDKQELDTLLRMVSPQPGEAYGPITESHASSMARATTTYTTASVPSATTNDWPLGTVKTTPTFKAECLDGMMRMNNVNSNISASLRKMVIVILVLLTVLVVVAAGVGVLYCTYRCRNKYLEYYPRIGYQSLPPKRRLYITAGPSSPPGITSPERSFGPGSGSRTPVSPSFVPY